MTAWIRTRSSRDRLSFSVLYRMGGRDTPIRSAGTYHDLPSAEEARSVVATQIAAASTIAPPKPRNRTEDQLVYIGEFEGGLLKIGVSVDPDRRCRELHLTLLHTERGGFVRESYLHGRFDHLRTRGEYFRSGRGEIKRYIRMAKLRAVAEAAA